MTEKESLIVKELITLTLEFDIYRVDNGYAPAANQFISGMVRNDIYRNYRYYPSTISWNFHKIEHSALLGLYIDHQLKNIVYHNKPKNYYHPFKNVISIDNNDYNEFLKIFERFYL